MFDTPITQLERRHSSFKSVEKKFAMTLHSTQFDLLVYLRSVKFSRSNWTENILLLCY